MIDSLREKHFTVAARLTIFRSPRLSQVVAFGLPLVVYLFTLAPTVYNLDSAELTTAAATGGLTRATGYPLYLILGYLWSHLPLGDVGYRMNLFSALNGALTIALTERILHRLGVGPWATLAGLGLLATAPYFWALSLVAEVYTLHTALMAALILSIMRWAEQPRPVRLSVFGLVLGLSLGHHAATVLLLPGFAWYILASAPRAALNLRAWLAAAAGLLLGLSVYLYLPLRYAAQPAFNYAGYYDASGAFSPVNLQTWQGIAWLVTARRFASQMFGYRLDELWPQVVHFVVQIARSFLTIGIGPGLLGMAILLRRRWKLGGMLLSMFLLHAIFYINYRVADKEVMYLPDFLIWAIWVGIGCQWLLAWVSDPIKGPFPDWWVPLLKGLLIAGVLIPLVWNWSLVDLSRDRSARERGEAILAEVKPDALIFGYWDTIPIIEYLQLVEHKRPDIQAVNRFLIDSREMSLWILHQVSTRPIYIDSLPGDLTNSIYASQISKLYYLQACRKYRDRGCQPQ